VVATAQAVDSSRQRTAAAGTVNDSLGRRAAAAAAGTVLLDITNCMNF